MLEEKKWLENVHLCTVPIEHGCVYVYCVYCFLIRSRFLFLSYVRVFFFVRPASKLYMIITIEYLYYS